MLKIKDLLFLLLPVLSLGLYIFYPDNNFVYFTTILTRIYIVIFGVLMFLAWVGFSMGSLKDYMKKGDIVVTKDSKKLLLSTLLITIMFFVTWFSLALYVGFFVTALFLIPGFFVYGIMLKQRKDYNFAIDLAILNADE
jgi:hypothetical protein